METFSRNMKTIVFKGAYMKKNLICILLILFIAFTASTLEFGADFRLGNLSFAQTRTSGDHSFAGDVLDWGISLFGSQKISDALTIKTGFYSDRVLRNIAYTTVSYVEGIMVIEVGPFFGYFNSELDPILKPGISASVKLDFPGILFIGTLNTRLTADLDYIQERTSVNGGFYVENAICTLAMTQKKFTQINKDGNEVDDSLLEFSFLTDLYQKNTPYRVNIGFAYQMLTKSFFEGGTEIKHTLGSILVTSALEFNITEAIFFVVGADASLYTYGYDELLAISAPAFLMNSHAGFRINLDRFAQLGKID
jgi:hypothetical protein